MQLMNVGPEDGQVIRQLERDLDSVRAQRVADQVECLVHHEVQIDLLTLRRMLARQGEEVPHDAGAAVGRFRHLVELSGHLWIVAELALEEPDPTGHHGKRVVELVGHAGQKLSHGGHLLGLEKSLGALAHLLLEMIVLDLERLVEEAGLQEILNAQEDFRPVQGLREEIPGAGGEGPASGFRGDVGREDEDGKVRTLGDERLELLHDREAVELWHEQIQEEQVGPELTEQRQDLARVGRARDVHVAGAVQQALEEVDVGRLIVRDQDPRALERVRVHDLSRFRCSGCRRAA